MGTCYGFLRSAAVLLTCASLVAYPCAVHAGPFMQVEVDDTEDFAAGMKKFLGGEGFGGSQMQKFLQAPKREWSGILDRFAEQFGFSPRIISTLLSGRVIVRIDKNAFLIGSTQKDSEAVDSLVTEIKKLLKSSPDLQAAIEEGQDAMRITVSVPGSALLIGAKGNRFAMTGGKSREAAEDLCDQFILGVIKDISEMSKSCPQLRGKGMLMMQDPVVMINDDVMVDGAPPANPMAWFAASSFNRMYFQNDDLWAVGYFPGRETIMGSLYVEGPVSEATLAWLPAACEGAAAMHVNPSGLIPFLLEKEGGVAAGEGQPVAGVGIAHSLEMAKRTFGFDLQNDFLGHIGDEVVFGQLPTGKGGGFPLFSAVGLGSVYGAIRLKDPMAFEAGLDKLLTLLGGMAAQDTVGGGLRRTMIGGLPIRYLRLACGVLSPCFAIKDGYLVVTSNIPLMEFLLKNHGTWKTLAEDADFRTNLALLSEKPVSGFSYKRHHRRDGGGGTTAALTGVAITGILAGMLLPALGKARGQARKVMCLNNLKQIGLGCKMYAMDHDDRWPNKLSDLHGEYINTLQVFACPHTGVKITKREEIDTRSPYVLTAGGLADEDLARRVVVYEKKGIHKGGSNVLFGDGHVEWVNDFRLAELLQRPPQVYVAGPAGPGGPGQPGAPTALTADSFKTFMAMEARNLAMSVDFALFPPVGDFSREGSSNMSIVDVREDGIFSKAKIGHLGGGASDSMVVVAVIAIIAAIAVPSLMRARRAARPRGAGRRRVGNRLAANEISAIGGLKQLTSHESAFRQIDGDGNGRKDYWTADVAGFYALQDVQGNKLKFIDVAMARADAAPQRGVYSWNVPMRPQPKNGYHFKAMSADEAGNSYKQDPDGDGKKCTHLAKFAFCAYPFPHGKAGRRTFIVNEEGVVYAKDTRGMPVDSWPAADPTEVQGWAVAD